jgi:hypothetical protein
MVAALSPLLPQQFEIPSSCPTDMRVDLNKEVVESCFMLLQADAKAAGETSSGFPATMCPAPPGAAVLPHRKDPAAACADASDAPLFHLLALEGSGSLPDSVGWLLQSFLATQVLGIESSRLGGGARFVCRRWLASGP